MVERWNQRASNNAEEDDLIHSAKMNRTRYSSRYSAQIQIFNLAVSD
jgi:hypothetical protein